MLLQKLCPPSEGFVSLACGASSLISHLLRSEVTHIIYDSCFFFLGSHSAYPVWLNSAEGGGFIYLEFCVLNSAEICCLVLGLLCQTSTHASWSGFIPEVTQSIILHYNSVLSYSLHSLFTNIAFLLAQHLLVHQGLMNDMFELLCAHLACS